HVGCDARSPPPASSGSECVSTVGEERASQPTWVLETSMGTMRLTLYCDKTPLTGQHFVNLTEEGYFDGTKFHRVIRNFMNQGGDPLTKDDAQAARWGTGGPTDASGNRYGIVDEFYCADGTVSYTLPAQCPSGLGLKHDAAGVLSMANTGQPRSGGSQFFITAVATPHLDGRHAIFGRIADQESLDVALAINRAPTAPGDRPNPPIVLERATIDWG
ncbi:MAG TPA: peptidylprolyl isomerase, partial [Candidatus Thermoplasmatota archaeon]|nr:peptidylprolyl isomerase [Candidatus Thermoplasmatota archaeon]